MKIGIGLPSTIPWADAPDLLGWAREAEAAGFSTLALLMGGISSAATRRTVEYGVGWISGLGGPAIFTGIAEKVRAAWRDAGRAGEPRLVHLEYYALGAKAEEDAHRYLTDYYAFLGNFAERIAAGALTGSVRLPASAPTQATTS